MRTTATLTKLCKMVFTGVLAVALATASFLPVSALSDGAYVVNRTTSYTNPETGQTVDGGTNIALGDSMADSIVEDQVLVEQTEGKIYVTIGLGLMSSVSNVRIQVQSADGSYRDAAITQTGSCTRIGDTCNHYRFEVESLDRLISPIIYVDPMGRDVQFFVQLDPSSAQSGTGNFVSEMIGAQTTTQTQQPAASQPAQTATASSDSEPADPPEETSSTASQPEETSQAESALWETQSELEETSTPSGSVTSSGLSTSSSSAGSGMIAVIVILAVAVVAGGVVLTVILVRKKKGK